MISFIYSKCFNVLGRKPVKLWGMSLLYLVVSAAACVLGLIPIIYIPIAYVLYAGMALIFLRGYKGEEPETPQLFAGFSGTFKDFLRIAGGLAWMSLWIVLWSMIPIVGLVFGVIKTYAYRFTPYILMTRPEVSATEALKLSMQMTEGYKSKMFFADLLAALVIFGVMLVFGLLATVRYVGGVFGAFAFLFLLLVYAFGPLFFGLLSAAFYAEVEDMTPEKMASFTRLKYQNPNAGGNGYNNPNYSAATASHQGAASETVPCPGCGAQVVKGAKFCPSCGKKLSE